MNNEDSSHTATRLHASIHISPNPHNPQTNTHTHTRIHNQPTNSTPNIDPRSPTALFDTAIDENYVLGDSIYEKDPSSLRFVLQNPNGLSYQESCFEYQLCLAQMNSVSADVIMLSETNLLWKDYNIHKHTTEHRRNLHTHSRQNTSFSAKHYGTPYQPGGTCSILTNAIVGHYHSSQKDSILGRWNVINLNIAGGKVLSIVCCYQTCHTSTNQAGPKTFYMQQWSLLRERDVTNPQPRKQFYRDLDTVLTSLRNSGNSIVLAGDFNESLGDDAHGLDRIVIKHQLTDSVAHRHGPYTTTTYSRGSKCLDYIFVSHDLLPSVQRCGILPFDEIFTSDHRAVFLDLDPRKSIGTELSPLWSPASRRLHSRNMELRNEYISHLTGMFHDHNIFHRAEKLERFCYSIEGFPQDSNHDENVAEQSQESVHVPLTLEEAITLAESIDRDVTRLMIASEKKLKQRSPFPFSSTLAQCCLAVSILKLHRYCQTKNKDKTSSLERLQSHRKERVTLPDTIDETNKALKQARKDLKAARKEADQLRYKFLDELIANLDDPKVVERIRKAEELRLSYLKIKHVLKPSTASLVTQLEVPTDDTPPKEATSWKRIIDPAAVTARIFERNTKHFGSAHGTPFTVPPLSDAFDWSATSASHRNTLQGAPPLYENDLVNQLLQHTAKIFQSTSCASPYITMPQIVRRFRKWKESTSTSPSRRHLGHYKSLLPTYKYKLEEYVESDRGRLMKIHLILLNFCAATGHSLRRWHKIVTTMIPKESNNFKLHRLRVIHLYEADLTALFSIWLKRMMISSEANATINQGSYGARPGRTSTDPPFLTVMQTEIAALSRSSLGNGPNDATQCYDRIIPNHATLSSVAHGMPPSAATCIGSTLSHAKYHLRTALSETATFWSNTPTTPIYGTGQGSGISPGLCSVTYSDIFDVHEMNSLGAQYRDPTNTISTTINNIGFVDDTTTTVNDLCLPSPLTPASLCARLEDNLQKWGNLLHVAGGALELSKTQAQLLTWDFRPNGEPYPSDNRSHSITVSCPHTLATKTIGADSNSTSYKVLGFHISMDQNMDKQFEKLRNKAHRIANSIAGSSVDRRQALLTYHAVFIPSVSYVLPLTQFTKKQCHELGSVPTRLFLQKCGFASTTKREIVYASRQSGGLGFRDLRIDQGIAHIIKLLQVLRTPGQPNIILRIALGWWQAQCGAAYPLLQYPNRPCLHQEGSWLRYTRDFLSEVDGSIETNFQYHHNPLRSNDVAIMDALCESKQYGRRRLLVINYCRLYLQVTFLSELTSACGRHLIPEFWQGNPAQRQSSPLFRYPTQNRPSSKSWSIWKSAIRSQFCQPHSSRLRIPLLTWTVERHQRHHVVSGHPPCLWVSSTTYHKLLHRHRTRLVFDSTPMISTIPSHTVPVDILSSASTITTSIPSDRLPPTPVPNPIGLEARLNHLASWQEPLLSGIDHHCPLVDIISHLSCPFGSTSEIISATDGSAKDSIASFGWCIRLDDIDIITCSGPVSGPSPGSYRAECYGMLSLLLYLHLVTRDQPSPVPFSQMTIYLDCQSLLKRLILHQSRQYFTPREAVSPERDVLMQIESLLDILSISFSFQFVKGHQDDDKPIDQLESAALANISADALASSALSSTPPSPSVIFFPASICQILIRHIPITRNVANTIRHLIHEPPMRKYIISSRPWSFTCDIDWKFYSLICHQNYRRPTFFVKWTHRILPVGYVVHRRHARESPYCPACGEFEDHDHFLQCDHASWHDLKRKLITDLRCDLERPHFDSVLCDILLEGVLSVLHCHPFPFHKFSARYQSLCQSQSNLGWANLLKGFCSIHWRRLHNEYSLQNLHRNQIDQLGPLKSLRLLIQNIQSIWNFRNSQRHGVDNELHQSELSRQTIDTIVDLYELRDRVLPCDKHLFFSSVDDHLSQPQSSLRAWVTNHSEQLFRSHQQAIKDNVTHTHSITTYFS